MNVAIVDYGSGNLRSAAKAFERAAEAVSTRINVTDHPADLVAASHIVLPGVGAFGDCMRGLAAVPDMIPALEDAVVGRATPFLGICVGMQLMATTGREHGDQRGLDWIGGEVVPILPECGGLKVPHMGWNELQFGNHQHPVFAGLASGTHVYFVHSYRFRCADLSTQIAVTDYGGAVTAAVARENMIGTQFHPEKSQAAGLRIIENFLGWRP